MPRVTFNRLSKKRAKTKRRTTSVITRAKYQKPTAQNQKKQILSNAVAIRALRRIMPTPVRTDWQYTGSLVADSPDASFSKSLKSVQLMSPPD